MSVQEVTSETVEPLALEDVVATFQRWLYLPDDLPLLAILGTVTANRLAGDPVWLLLVGPPGSGKSELLQALGVLSEVHAVATLTEAALLSGTKQKERSVDAKGGMLRSIGDYGIILAKDFGSVLSMHRDARQQVLAALREIYDGSWTRRVGVDGGRALFWAGKVGLIAGCTPTIDRHHAVMGSMGERFVLMRMREDDSTEQAKRALAHAGREKAMRKDLGEAVAGLFASELREPIGLTAEEHDRLVSIATLVVRCRSAVERDSYTREIELVPGAEAPTRFVVQLDRLLAGLDVVGVPRAKSWEVVTRVAFDSMPAIRRRVIEVLLDAETSPVLSEMSTTDVAVAVDYPRTTAERTLEELVAYQVVKKTAHGQGKSHTWQISPWAAEKWVTNSTSPVLSDEETTSPVLSPQGEKGKSNRESNLYDFSTSDISGEVGNGTLGIDAEELWRLRLEAADESPEEDG